MRRGGNCDGMVVCVVVCCRVIGVCVSVVVVMISATVACVCVCVCSRSRVCEWLYPMVVLVVSCRV